MTKNSDDLVKARPVDIIEHEALERVKDLPVHRPESGHDLLGKDKGFVIGARGYELMRVSVEAHLVTMGKPGSGKGTAVIIPNLLTHEGSVFSVEIGGASYKATHNFRRHVLGQNIIVFDPFNQAHEESACFNVFDFLDEKSLSFVSDVKEVADSLLAEPEGAKSDNPYWITTPPALLSALIIHVKTSPDIDEEDRHLPYLSSLLGRYPSPAWDELMDRFKQDDGLYQDIFHEIGNLYHGTTGSENARSVVSSVSQTGLGFVKDPAFSRLLKTSTYNPRDLCDNNTTVYVIVPDEGKFTTNSAFFRMLIERSFAAFPNPGDGGVSRKNDRALFLLDEFTQLGYLKAVKDGVNTLRQKGITLWTIFQNYALLQEVYGERVASTFLSTADVIQILQTSEILLLEFTSKKIGKKMVAVESVQHGKNWGVTDTDTWNKTHVLGGSVINTGGDTVTIAETWQEGTNESVQTSEGNSEGSNRGESRGGQDSKTLHKKRRLFFFDKKLRNYDVNKGTNHTEQEGTFTSRNEQVTHAMGRNSMQGGQTSEARMKSRAVTDIDTTADSKGGSTSRQRGGSYAVTTNYQIMQAVEPAQLEQMLGTNNGQIVLLRANNDVRNFLDFRANYREIPELINLAIGPGNELYPAPVWEPPLLSNERIYSVSDLGPIFKPEDYARIGKPQPSLRIEFANPVINKPPKDLDPRWETIIAQTDVVMRAILHEAEIVNKFTGDIKASQFVPMPDATFYVSNSSLIEQRARELKYAHDVLHERRQVLQEAEDRLNMFRQILLEELQQEEGMGREWRQYAQGLEDIAEIKAKWAKFASPTRPEELALDIDIESAPGREDIQEALEALTSHARQYKTPSPPFSDLERNGYPEIQDIIDLSELESEWERIKKLNEKQIKERFPGFMRKIRQAHNKVKETPKRQQRYIETAQRLDQYQTELVLEEHRLHEIGDLLAQDETKLQILDKIIRNRKAHLYNQTIARAKSWEKIEAAEAMPRPPEGG